MKHVCVLFGALALTSLSFAACGVTPGRRIAVSFSAHGTATPFETSAGWRVTLSEASLVIGPVYVLAPGARQARAESLRAILLPTAFAHGGHDDYAALDVRAEWLDQASLDLLAPSVLLGEGDGTAGLAESTTLDLEMPSDASGPTHGHFAWVHGVATPITGGDPIEFEGGLDLPDEPLARSVESIASVHDMTSDGRLEIGVEVAGRDGLGPSWLEQAHFDRLPEPASGSVRTLAPGTQPYNAWLLAARDADAFTTTYTPEAP